MRRYFFLPYIYSKIPLSTKTALDLFEYSRKEQTRKDAPLADRMRPQTLDQFIGQSHILAPGRLLRRAIQADQLSSLIFYGPPGTGKTTLARIIANTTKAQFLSINAVLAGVKDIRASIASAEEYRGQFQRRSILFVDEVHRFNKAQQDALLPHVENGVIILIGATTENPYFEVNKALVSRSRIFQLKQLEEKDLLDVIDQALEDEERGFGKQKIQIDQKAKEHLVNVANGDARAVLNALELAVVTSQPQADGIIRIDLDIAEESIQQRAVLYDKDGDAHFDTISAFIKSVRGSDPDAALYWMSKMVYAGEDPRYIFRRMLISASEDIGMADPNALSVVVSASQAYDYVGMPEGRFHLAQACLYLATAPKSNSNFAFFDALATVQKEKDSDVPNHLRDANRDKEDFGHGKGYLYPHAYQDHWVAQQYLPSSLQGRLFYNPTNQGYEKEIQADVIRRREAQLAIMMEEQSSDSSQQAWQERTFGNSGEQLGEIRDKLFSSFKIATESLILDLNAGTGLLLNEALRKDPQATAYALVKQPREEAILKNQFKNERHLIPPVLIPTNPNNYQGNLLKLTEEKIKFHNIIGRQIIRDFKDKTDFFNLINPLLEQNGSLALAETIPAEGQRISDFLKESSISEELSEKFFLAEQEIYNDPENPKLNWNLDTIKKSCAEADLEINLLQKQYFETSYLITNKKIEGWFSPEQRPGKKSLWEQLALVISAEEIEQIKQTLQKELSGKMIQWKTCWFVLVAKPN